MIDYWKGQNEAWQRFILAKLDTYLDDYFENITVYAQPHINGREQGWNIQFYEGVNSFGVQIRTPRNYDGAYVISTPQDCLKTNLPDYHNGFNSENCHSEYFVDEDDVSKIWDYVRTLVDTRLKKTD